MPHSARQKEQGRRRAAQRAACLLRAAGLPLPQGRRVGTGDGLHRSPTRRLPGCGEDLTDTMDRRCFLQAAAAVGLPAVLGAWPSAAGEPATGEAPHRFADVVARARALAAEPYAPAEAPMPAGFADLDARDYAAIAPDPKARLDLGGVPPFALEPLPPGFIYTDPVSLALVEGRRVRPIPFSAHFFRIEGGTPPETAAAETVEAETASEGEVQHTFSGFRLCHALDGADALEEVASFQGASNFRARFRGGLFGASARGLAIATGEPDGEEVPRFTALWVHAAEGEAAEIIVHALLDSPSVAGAFAFVIRPGDATVIDASCRLFPRADIPAIGIAPLSSMHLFGPDGRGRFDDLRDAVHDSDGLHVVTGRGERLWRPLVNPARPRISGFVDTSPRGFGLAQRVRDFARFGDATAGFERRPSVWVEPRGEWGPGQVVLVEIPLPNEANDNIVAFWRPSGGLAAGSENAFDYRLTFAPLPPDSEPLARVVATRSGADGEEGRRFAVDFDCSAVPEGPLEPRITSSQGLLSRIEIVETPEPDRVRVAFRFAPSGADLSEFRLVLYGGDGRAVSETWLYRWTRA
jgi:periplasmic glucans biosynthesis protein